MDHVGDVVALLDELAVPACHLVGASFGAGVAVETALTRPDRVRSLLLAPPGGSLLAELTPALRSFFAAENDALALGDLGAAVDANVDTWVVGAGREEAAVTPGVVAAVRVMQRRAFDIAADWGPVDTVELDPPALERLDRLTAPILVVVGGHDLDTTHDAADRVIAGATSGRPSTGTTSLTSPPWNALQSSSDSCSTGRTRRSSSSPGDEPRRPAES